MCRTVWLASPEAYSAASRTFFAERALAALAAAAGAATAVLRPRPIVSARGRWRLKAQFNHLPWTGRLFSTVVEGATWVAENMQTPDARTGFGTRI